MDENNTYGLSSSMREGILEIVMTGELTNKTINSLHDEVINIIKEKKANAVLCDVRSITGPQEFAEAYFRARSLPTDVQMLPSAIVEKSVNRDFKAFYETTSANAGHMIKWFTDVNSARAWLKSKIFRENDA